MAQTTDFANFDHLTFCLRLRSSELRSVFVERQMSAPVSVIASIRRENTMQRALPEDDDVIQRLATNGTNEPFDMGLRSRYSK